MIGSIVCLVVKEHKLSEYYFLPSSNLVVAMRGNIIDRRDLTNFGWFHPNPEFAIGTGRFKSSAVYADAIVKHPRYNSSAWTRRSNNPDPTRPIVAFIDVETCGETCWPVMCSYETSVDLENNRTAMPGYLHNNMCELIERALSSPAMNAPSSRLVVMSCFPGHPNA